jgi:hypothetical protein
VQDLTKLGYKWPDAVDDVVMNPPHASNATQSAPTAQGTGKDGSRKGPALEEESERLVLKETSEAVQASMRNPRAPLLPRWWCKQPDVLLVIVYNHATPVHVIELLNRAYGAMFFKVGPAPGNCICVFI